MTKDDWRLLRYGLLTALIMAVVLTPILIRDVGFPKLAAEAILGVIAGAIFLLSKYMEHRKKSN
jgi:Kef-type K+ transport system membrane component KefB